jgi:phosphatidylinositol alpha-mannosyltransferase
VRILPIPVDTERFAPLADDLWLTGLERPVLVFVGRADDPRKNVGLLLEALPALRARVPGVRVRLVGAPPDRVPDGVEATGPVPDVAPHLRDAALFVLPSLQEGFGIVAAEALAAGVPVLATPSGGPEDLLRASGGGVVLRGFEAGELASTAADLLGDAGTLLAMRSRGREHVVREHGPERFRRLLGEALRELG